jgi:hypothetical protein
MPVPYAQQCGTFLPRLSIIDVLMFNDIETVRHMLDSFQLLRAGEVRRG